VRDAGDYCWRTRGLKIDCFSTFVNDWDGEKRPAVIVRNGEFVDEARMLKRLSGLYLRGRGAGVVVWPKDVPIPSRRLSWHVWLPLARLTLRMYVGFDLARQWEWSRLSCFRGLAAPGKGDEPE